MALNRNRIRIEIGIESNRIGIESNQNRTGSESNRIESESESESEANRIGSESASGRIASKLNRIGTESESNLIGILLRDVVSDERQHAMILLPTGEPSLAQPPRQRFTSGAQTGALPAQPSVSQSVAHAVPSVGGPEAKAGLLRNLPP